MSSELLTLWSNQPALSLAIWAAMIIFMMYLGRKPSHQLLRSSGRGIYRLMRLSARTLALWQEALAERNRSIILASGKDATERAIEREFERIKDIVARDLAHYPSLHRQISDVVGKIETDYHASAETPPAPPSWLDAVEAVGAIPKSADPAVAKIMDNIHDTIVAAHDETLSAYRKSSQERHRILGKLQPLWRNMVSQLGEVNTKFEGIGDRARIIDEKMQEYQKIREGEESVLQALTLSSLTQFFIGGVVLVIAVMGGLINFQLIAMPMSEMVGGNSYIGGMRTSDIAALVIILVEIAMGLFLLESLRITHLFPIIGSMDDKMRRKMMLITLTILTILATVEASLAYMRDLLALDREALTQSLAGNTVVEANFRWIPSVGQMVMGFILPFALAFVAIPLESFVHAARTVLGLVAQGVLQLLSVCSRLLGTLGMYSCRVLTHLYDLVIMVPLSIETWVAQGRIKFNSREALPSYRYAYSGNDNQGNHSVSDDLRGGLSADVVEPELPMEETSTDSGRKTTARKSTTKTTTRKTTPRKSRTKKEDNDDAIIESNA
ncbi:hypothetical protein [Marinibactrum halimedae]|uniref:Uncharacterized protein n=1 Tax=Marinibactrum halimedae TaxID=1444977 RepID=A0AA37WN95_9GAMM|nr:hypothetical protein [Marinibactrum halimedae]MCD9460889.1 hypothetical protein [Marinibactrum halimedae]GLS27333.1 hypothetical protein GCM10007877_30520 [Marinibactrum halimedae]